MIKLALKHLIYELCIEQLFNGIRKNFIIYPPTKYKIGEKYGLIEFRITSSNYHIIHATISDIQHGNIVIAGDFYVETSSGGVKALSIKIVDVKPEWIYRAEK